jgi:hypothetical protein
MSVVNGPLLYVLNCVMKLKSYLNELDKDHEMSFDRKQKILNEIDHDAGELYDIMGKKFTPDRLAYAINNTVVSLDEIKEISDLDDKNKIQKALTEIQTVIDILQPAPAGGRRKRTHCKRTRRNRKRKQRTHRK